MELDNTLAALRSIDKVLNLLHIVVGRFSGDTSVRVRGEKRDQAEKHLVASEVHADADWEAGVLAPGKEGFESILTASATSKRDEGVFHGVGRL